MGVQMLSDLKQEFYKFFHPVGRKTNPILLDLELRYIFYTMIWPVSFFRFVTFSIFHFPQGFWKAFPRLANVWQY